MIVQTHLGPMKMKCKLFAGIVSLVIFINIRNLAIAIKADMTKFIL